MDNKPQKGFTLLEVIMCLVLVAIISATTYSVLIFTLENKEKVEKRSLQNKVGQAILKLVSRDLEGLYTLNVDNPFEGVDDGTHDSINFTSTVSSMPDEEGVSSNLIEVGYKLVPNEAEGKEDLYILLRRESYSIEKNPLKGGNFYEVYDQVKDFNLQYYDGEEWYDSWSYSEMKSIPLAVKVEFVIRTRTGESEDEIAREEERNEDKEYEKQEGYFSAIVTIPVVVPTTP